MKDKNIGFIGIGNVGCKIANNILNEGFNLYIYDLDKKSSTYLVSKGAIWCDTLAELIKNVTVFITCLPSPNSVRDVISNSLLNINQNHLWIEMSTTDEEEMKSLSELILSKKAEVIEAPITGGQHNADS